MKTLSPTFRVCEGAEAGRRAPRSADDEAERAGFFAFVPAADPGLVVSGGRVRSEAASGAHDGSAAAAALMAVARRVIVGGIAPATLGVGAA